MLHCVGSLLRSGNLTGSCSSSASLLDTPGGSTQQAEEHKHQATPSRKQRIQSLRSCLQHRFKCSKASRSQQELEVSHSSFAATGSEDIRTDLAHYGFGSINWCNLVVMGERLHKMQLQQVQEDPNSQCDWAGEPAWQDDFSGIAGQYAKKMHYKMEWTYFGGQAVAHIPDELWWNNSGSSAQTA